MKILVLSDTHGKIDKSLKIIEKNKIDLIIHLGDYSSDAKDIANITGLEVLSVKGNCDFNDKETNEELIVTIKNKKMLITHGHLYNVKVEYNSIYYRAKEVNADLVLFGHTHRPFLYEGEIIMFNPGSIEYPYYSEEAGYGIIEISSEDIKVYKKIINFK